MRASRPCGRTTSKPAVAAEDAKDLKPFGLDKPVRSVTLGLADGGTRRIEIGSSPEDRKYHAREALSSLVAVIPAALVDDLAKGMKELRAKRVVDVGTYEVEGVEIEAEGKKTVLARTKQKDAEGLEQEKWARTAPDKKDIDRAKVDEALFKLTGLEVQDFLDAPGPDASYGLDAPAASVTLKREQGKPTRRASGNARRISLACRSIGWSNVNSRREAVAVTAQAGATGFNVPRARHQNRQSDRQVG